MSTPKQAKYSREHEWVIVESENIGRVGITDYAQEHLGDVVFVDLPEQGSEVAQFGKAAEVESVKAVSDIYAPVAGEIVETNQRILENPELVNEDPYGKGWLFRVRLANLNELDSLMSAEEYEAHLGQIG